MTVRFMGDTPCAVLEIEMQLIPGISRRKSGISISHLEDGERGEKSSRRKGQERKDGRAEEDFAAGTAPVEELLKQFAKEVAAAGFTRRVSRLSAQSPPVFFLAGHRGRFAQLWRRRQTGKAEAAWGAALYLLSADTFLWGRAMAAVGSEEIRFCEMKIHGVDLEGYVLYQTAKALYQGSNRISLSELTDPELFSDRVFRLVVTAFLIRRHGVRIL